MYAPQGLNAVIGTSCNVVSLPLGCPDPWVEGLKLCSLVKTLLLLFHLLNEVSRLEGVLVHCPITRVPYTQWIHSGRIVSRKVGIRVETKVEKLLHPSRIFCVQNS